MHKIFSYLLIAAGILMILFTVNSMYKVFADKKPVTQIVQIDDMQMNTPQGVVQMPMKSISQFANLGLFALFMMFLAGAGAKIAGIGNGMLKNERIHDALLELRPEEVKNADVFKTL